MHINRIALCLALVASSLVSPVTSASNLRNTARKLRNPKSLECTIVITSDYRDLEVASANFEEEGFECVLDPSDADGISNLSFPIIASVAQKQVLKEKLNKGELISDHSTLLFGNGVQLSADGVHVPPGLEIALGKRPNKDRRLAVLTGDKPILVVKVTDSVGKARVESPAVISSDVFSDALNLKSQMHACSFGQLNIVPGDTSFDPDADPVAAPGVIEVTISITLEGNSRAAIRNAVTTAVQAKLGTNLPGPYQQVIYVLENCYLDCGWAAYAYVNSWNSVFQSAYYKHVGVQMHELGHNFNLAHSGGLDGATYTDHTGYMGNPCYADDFCAMCFNAAKNWQLPWYNTHKLLIDPRQGPWSGTIVGIADFQNNPSNHPVVLKIETGTTTDQFIGFNRAAGVNYENDEADNEVTIVETGGNGQAYSQSFLKAHLVQGEVYTYPNWAGTGANLVVTVNLIDIAIATGPGIAQVSICLGSDCDGGCTSVSDCDDLLYCNGQETCNVASGICQSGTPPACDNDMFCDGQETCSEANGGSCVAGTPPSCDNGAFCDGQETCSEANGGSCVAGTPLACDNGMFCDGQETCSEANGGSCVAGTPPACDNGVFCDGQETCSEADGGSCVAGPLVDCSNVFSFCGGAKICRESDGACVDNGLGLDGVCSISSGESCDSCRGDCVKPMSTTTCGNGICENGEDCGSCPSDCNGRLSGNKNQRYCCVGGPVGTCSDSRCTGNGNTCSTTTITESCCGDGTCEGTENFLSCPSDCGVPVPTQAPTKAPIKAPTLTAPTSQAPVKAPTSACPICSVTGVACCGTCRDWGKPSARGCF